MKKNKLLRMDNVGIVTESLEVASSFFSALGMNLEGRATMEGETDGEKTWIHDFDLKYKKK